MTRSTTDLLKTGVLIIGAGVTGTGLARDLSLRGIPCILVERKDFNAGASGGNHGLLHSGARYVLSDPSAAVECQKENRLLKKLAPQCIEDTGGLFVAVEGDDENYVADFAALCARLGIESQALEAAEARESEPALSEKIFAAFKVNDAAIDPFKLSLENISHARQHGAVFLPHSRAIQFECRNHRVQTVLLTDIKTGRHTKIETDFVVNASGAWAGDVAALAGIRLRMIYSKGSLLVTQSRMAGQVINRLRRPTDGDILVPGGTVSILGTTSVRIESLADYRPTVEEVDRIISEGAMMMPALESTRFIRAYSGIRPLLDAPATDDDRSVSRGFALIDHTAEGMDNFATITGGKLTTYRLMAEKTADFICRRFGTARPCRTQAEPLPAASEGRWTEPGLAPRLWLQNRNPDDIILCECEMIPQSVVDSIVQSIRGLGARTDLKSIGLHGRIGKGPCQGAFCSTRVTAYLYDQGLLDARHGIEDLTAFLDSRWRGQKPLMWGCALIQAELQEAMHCGLLGLELEEDASGRRYHATRE
jgi:glycerol-3-phosphate dehydrogenase